MNSGITSREKGEAMVRHRRWLVLGASAAAGLALVAAPGAPAATPTQIYKDLADNGRLDGTYSRADLQRALKDASVQGYGKPTVRVRFKPKVQQAIGAAGAERAVTRRALPFTGLDLVLLGVVAVALVGSGIPIQRISRAGDSDQVL
jgi:hypothetical protein